jgi:hypothetical protein
MPVPTSPRLSTVQTITLAVIGAVYWFIAALIVRWTAANWVGNDPMTAVVFGLIVVGTVPALLLGYRVAGVARAHAAIGATIMTAAALLLDGVALTWVRALYGSDPATVLGGSAAIMWGAGIALVLGMAIERRSALSGS